MVPTIALIVLADVEAMRVTSRVAATLHPLRAAVEDPESLGPLIPVALRTADGLTLRGWYVPSRSGAAIVLAHGHGSQRGQLAFEARALTNRGYGVLLFDFRGHGESDGGMTTWGIAEQRDIEAAIDYLSTRADVDPGRLGALGFSMGAMTLAMVAARDQRLRAIVLEGSYTTLEEMIRHDERHYGWWSERAAVAALRHRGISLDSVRPIDVICRVSPRPVFIVNGADDDDTPVGVARRLFAAACAPRFLAIVAGATHANYARGGAALANQIGEFFDRSLGRAIAAPPRR